MTTKARDFPLIGYVLMLLAGASFYAGLMAQGGPLQAVLALKGLALLCLSLTVFARQPASRVRVPVRKSR